MQNTQGFRFEAGRFGGFQEAIRRGAGRPRWVYGGTAFVVMLVMVGPLLALLLALLVAVLLGMVVFCVLDLLAKGVGWVTGAGRSAGEPTGVEPDAGRENVRVRQG
ncbi:MAG: hypothetical protein AAGI68_10130 [Planctomycetota bacterium]